MKLVYLDLDFNDYIVRITFDKLDSIDIEDSLQVCTSETIRGKNKTFNAYPKPTAITISGKFSDIKSNNIEIIKLNTTADSKVVEELIGINNLIGKNKSSRLNALFESMIEDTRLLNVKMFYDTYENYVITSFNLNYSNNNTINVTLNLQEMLFRDLNNYTDIEVPYKIQDQLDSYTFKDLIKDIKEKEKELVNAVKDLFKNLFNL